jgi:predicted extracellular nuclease
MRNHFLPRYRYRLSILAIAITFFLASYYISSPPPIGGGNPQATTQRVWKPAVSAGVVISQVYGGAGCGTAGCSTYKNDYIELFNRGNTNVSLNGWSVQYAAATGTSWQVTNLTNVTLQPGQYYLVAEGAGANGVNNLPTPDVTGSIAMSATAAKVALVNTTTALSGACPTGANIIDFVGYGTAANCNETANAPAPSTTTADIRAMNGCTETDNNSTDFAAGAPNPRNTSTTFNVCGGGGLPNLSINDVAIAEGNSGTTTFTFTVSLSSAAGAGGVSFNIATADGTAQDDNPATEDNDYVPFNLTGESIAQGNQTKMYSVTVNGDITPETNETFFVNVTSVTGANVTDGQGQGTINNDDVTITAIHDIQGNGSSSPLVGQSVTTSGIVTGLRSNGFYIQVPNASVDADPNTSEGMLVFTSSAPPAAAVIGNSVQVTGTVAEFRSSSANPNSATSTELTSPTVTLLSTGNALPTVIVLTTTDTNPAGPLEALEKFEHMRVRINSMTVVAPTDGFKTEVNATSTTSGVFWGVITGIARPFREPGIEAPNSLPSGSGVSIPPVPRFDANPEHIRVDSDGQPGSVALDVTTGAIITNIVGILDPGGFPNYTLYPDPTTVTPAPTISGIISAVPVPVPTADEFTVASFNLERFYDDINDTPPPPSDDVVLTTTAFNNRLNKASLAIRNILRTPDILGVEEMEDLKTLQALANKINTDAVAASQPNPNYVAYLSEGNDIGLIDVGFLVKTPRVNVISVTQFGLTTTYTNPNTGGQDLLNDRPPLVLVATITSPCGSPFPVTVIVNHLRSLNNVDDEAVDGPGTVGGRIRAKRRAQAEYLANLIQARQTADPNERIISIGDYNAFQFNDGLGDSIGTIKGTPTPANQVVLASPDLVNPDLVDLIDHPSVPADQKYSYSFNGNAQALDHELVNQPLMQYFSRFAYARVNGDFPEVYRSDANRPERISDHDAAVAYFSFNEATIAPNLAAYSATGGQGSFNLDILTTCPWTAVASDPWIIIVSADSGSGDAQISYEVRDNTGGTFRTGTITVAGKTFTITQNGGASCSYNLASANASFVAGGGSGTVGVIATAGCTWNATSTVNWITVTSGSPGSGNGTVNYSVAANSGPTRTGTLIIAGRTFTVKQKGLGF